MRDQVLIKPPHVFGCQAVSAWLRLAFFCVQMHWEDEKVHRSGSEPGIQTAETSCLKSLGFSRESGSLLGRLPSDPTEAGKTGFPGTLSGTGNLNLSALPRLPAASKWERLPVGPRITFKFLPLVVFWGHLSQEFTRCLGRPQVSVSCP